MIAPNSRFARLRIVALLAYLPLLSVSSAAFAGVGESTIAVGSASALYQRLETRAPASVVSIQVDAANAFDVRVTTHDVDGDYIAVSGTVVGQNDARFMFKGTSASMYGWLVLESDDLAWELHTSGDGQLQSRRRSAGAIFAVCDFAAHPPKHSPPQAHPAGWTHGPEPHIGEYPGTSVLQLESLPGAQKVFFLDISKIMTGEEPKHVSREEIWQLWQSVASAWSAYELNVTTNRSVYEAAGVANSGIACFLDQDGRSFAPLNSFGSTNCSTNYKQRDGYGYGRIAAHEIGHQMGLSHDGGQPGGEYFEGFPQYKWTALMGNVWPGNAWGAQALYQYSKGEYDTATAKQDDLEVMTRYVEFRADDHTGESPLVIESDGSVDPLKNRGQIGASGDSDEFSFSIGEGGGTLQLHIDRTEYIGGAMLDVAAVLLDTSGAEVAASNVEASRHAEFDLELDAGSYRLVVSGGAEGTPQQGFSNYSSIGFYAIEGTIENANGEDTGDSGDDDPSTDTGDDASESSDTSSSSDSDDGDDSESSASSGDGDGDGDGDTDDASQSDIGDEATQDTSDDDAASDTSDEGAQAEDGSSQGCSIGPDGNSAWPVGLLAFLVISSHPRSRLSGKAIPTTALRSPQGLLQRLRRRRKSNSTSSASSTESSRSKYMTRPVSGNATGTGVEPELMAPDSRWASTCSAS